MLYPIKTEACPGGPIWLRFWGQFTFRILRIFYFYHFALNPLELLWCFHTLSDRCCDTMVFSHPVGSVVWLYKLLFWTLEGFRMMFCAYKYKLHTSIFGMKHIFISIGLVRSQNTDPIGCENTMVSQHRSDKVWKPHYYFCEKKNKKNQ